MEYVQERKLLAAFEKAADFLVARIKEDGWQWSSNFLREYVRCSTKLKFSNTASPRILRLLRQRRPDLQQYITIEALKE